MDTASEQQQVRRTREPLEIPDQRRSRHTGPEEHWTQDQSNNRNKRRDKQLTHRIKEELTYRTRRTLDTGSEQHKVRRIREPLRIQDQRKSQHTGPKEHCI